MTISKKEVAKKLYSILLPYYKGGLPIRGHAPEFRRTLAGDEVQELLESIHNLVQELLGGES